MNLAGGEHRVVCVCDEILAQAMNRTKRGAETRAVVYGQQLKGARDAVRMRRDEHRCVLRALLACMECEYMLGTEAEPGEFTRTVDHGSGAPTGMEPLLATRVVCRVHIEQTPAHILHHGLLNADRTVGVVILLAIANPRHGHVRHRGRSQCRQLQIASLTHSAIMACTRYKIQ